jgi:MoaA/NifB/PqqE/SkfB family radical SAM enzyme
MGYSLGIGLTNNCNLSCAHCYRDTTVINNITLEQVQRICGAVEIDSVGMGTGENVLNPQFDAIVSYLKSRNIRLSVASNGHTLTSVSAEILQAFQDVEVSIDFPTQGEQDAFRGPGNWSLVFRAIERCQSIGLEVSILTTLMRTNYMTMDLMVDLARQAGVNLRVNAYQPVKTDAYRLTYEEFWEGYRRLFTAGLVVSCSEPVVRAAMGIEDVQSPCARRSIRINPRGQLIPCVYWPASLSLAPTIEDLIKNGDAPIDFESFQAARAVPPAAKNCRCQGGCASRRALNQNLDAHDEYCPWARGEEPALDWRPAPHKDLLRAGNVCTTIVV